MACFFYKYRRPYGTIKLLLYSIFIPYQQIDINTLYDYAEQRLCIEDQKRISQHLASHDMDREVVESYIALKEKGIDRLQLQAEYDAHAQRFAKYVQRNQWRYKVMFYVERCKEMAKKAEERLKIYLKTLFENPFPIPAFPSIILLFGIGIWTFMPTADIQKPQIADFTFFYNYMQKVIDEVGTISSKEERIIIPVVDTKSSDTHQSHSPKVTFLPPKQEGVVHISPPPIPQPLIPEAPFKKEDKSAITTADTATSIYREKENLEIVDDGNKIKIKGDSSDQRIPIPGKDTPPIGGNNPPH